MKPKYTEKEQREIWRWCKDTLELYLENIGKHGIDPKAAKAVTLNEIHEALGVDTEEFGKRRKEAAEPDFYGACLNCGCHNPCPCDNPRSNVSREG